MKEVNVNGREAWGQLRYDREFDACIGARFADNSQRDFGIFGDRITMVGDDYVVRTLKQWLFSKKTLTAIKRNTSFRPGMYDTPSCWASVFDIGRDKSIHVVLEVRCNGEYCYVAAYATKIPSGRIRVAPTFDDAGSPCWVAVIEDRPEFQSPYIYTDTRLKATNRLLDWIANNLEVSGALFDV